MKKAAYLPTISNSFSDAVFLILGHRSIVNNVLELLNIDVRELMIADNMTATKRPLNPEKKTSLKV